MIVGQHIVLDGLLIAPSGFETTGNVLDGGLGIQYTGGQDGLASVPDNTILEKFDSPNVKVGDVLIDGVSRSFQSVTVHDSFRLFLTYKPAGDDSIWVTLGELDWSWGCGVHVADSQTVWDFRSPPNPPPKGRDSTELPVWDRNAPTENDWVTE